MRPGFKSGDLIIHRNGSWRGPALLLSYHSRRRRRLRRVCQVLVGDNVEEWDESFIINWCVKLNET